MNPYDWQALKDRGNALRELARTNRQHFRGITDSMRAAHDDEMERDYIEALHEEELELWPSV